MMECGAGKRERFARYILLFKGIQKVFVRCRKLVLASLLNTPGLLTSITFRDSYSKVNIVRSHTSQVVIERRACLLLILGSVPQSVSVPLERRFFALAGRA